MKLIMENWRGYKKQEIIAVEPEPTESPLDPPEEEEIVNPDDPGAKLTDWEMSQQGIKKKRPPLTMPQLEQIVKKELEVILADPEAKESFGEAITDPLDPIGHWNLRLGIDTLARRLVEAAEAHMEAGIPLVPYTDWHKIVNSGPWSVADYPALDTAYIYAIGKGMIEIEKDPAGGEDVIIVPEKAEYEE